MISSTITLIKGKDLGEERDNESPRHNFDQIGMNNDASQWLYSDKVVDIASLQMNQVATNWPTLQNTLANSMHDTKLSAQVQSRAVVNGVESQCQNHSHPSSQWQNYSQTPSLDMQWQHANDNGNTFEINNAFNNHPHQFIPGSTHNEGQFQNHSTSSPVHSTFNAPNMGYTTSNLWQRRLSGRQHSSSSANPTAQSTASHSQGGMLFNGMDTDARHYALPQNGSESMSSTATKSGSSASHQTSVNAWSMDPNLCLTRQSSWNLQNDLTSSPQGFNPLMLQQPPHWIQRDRVHSRQSSADPTSPQTSTSDEVLQPPSLINSSRLSLELPPSPDYAISPRIKMEKRLRNDSEVDSGYDSHTAKHRRSAKAGKADVYKMEASYATLSKSSAALALPSTLNIPTIKKNISKVVVNKYGSIDGIAAHCRDSAEGKETRHLCPHIGCDKHFSTSGHARRHSRIHASLRPFECPHSDCDATFTRRDNCSQHQKSRHRSQLIARRLSKDH